MNKKNEEQNGKIEKKKKKEQNQHRIYHTSYHVAIRQNCGDETLCRETDNSKKISIVLL